MLWEGKKNPPSNETATWKTLPEVSSLHLMFKEKKPKRKEQTGCIMPSATVECLAGRVRPEMAPNKRKGKKEKRERKEEITDSPQVL